jgi:nitrate reductase beta subunit
MIDAAKRSPVWKFVCEWGLALPLHPEFRTLPMLYYVPPLLPVVGAMRGDVYAAGSAQGLFADLEKARVPIEYLAALFAAGDTAVVEAALRKLIAVRMYRRSLDPDDQDRVAVLKALGAAGLTIADAEAIYRLTALSTLEERYALPPLQREQADAGATETRKRTGGFGRIDPQRGA